jgi:cell division protease FtsH
MLGMQNNEPLLHREYSESTQQYIDEEIARMLNDRYVQVKALLSEKRELLDKISNLLLEKESLDEGEFKSLVQESVSP